MYLRFSGIISFNFDEILPFCLYGKSFDLVFCTINYCVGEVISTLMSLSQGLDPYNFRPKMEKTRSMMEDLDGSVYFPPKVAFFLCKYYY